MSHTRETDNYNLPLYDPDDRPTWLGEWNETMEAIDTGLKDNRVEAESASEKADRNTNSIEQLNQNIKAANENITEVQKQLESGKVETDKAYSELKNAVKLHTTHLNEIDITNESQGEKISDLYKKIEVVNNEQESLDNRVESLEDADVQNTTKIDEIDKRVEVLENSNKDDKTGSHIGQIIISTALDTMDKVVEAYGGITWVKIEDMFLIGASLTYPVSSTGGEAKHRLTIEEMPTHFHSVDHQHVINIRTTDNGTHNHAMYYRTTHVQNGTGAAKRTYGTTGDNAGTADAITTGGEHFHYVAGQTEIAQAYADNRGGNGEHNNIPPYKAVYMWERTE